MLSLGFDTSNYATSLALVDVQAGEVVCDKKQFLPVPTGQRGLRQSEALFHHTAALPELLAQLDEAVPLSKVQAVGVSATPRPEPGSYMPCFLAGVSAATAFARAAGLPLHRTSHQQGHVAAALLAAGLPELFNGPALFLHVSGGTTDLLLSQGVASIEKLGGSTDLYAGQAVDRLGVRLGFAFPAGEAVSALAVQCAEPVTPKVSVHGMECSLSGLENQCAALLENGHTPAYVCKYCLLCVAETLRRLLCAAQKAYPGLPMVCAGGVCSSVVIQKYLNEQLPEAVLVPGRFSSDNAIGVAVLAGRAALQQEEAHE